VLTVAAARQEHKVLLADFDPEQLSCVEWSAMRLRNGIAPDIEERVFNKLKTLRETASEFDLAFVDTRGLADELTKDISQESDVVFLPTGTSMDVLRPTLALARRLSKSKKDIKQNCINTFKSRALRKITSDSERNNSGRGF
jgi:chromosome partitioning protein